MKKLLIIALTLVAATSFASSYINWVSNPALANDAVTYFDHSQALAGGLLQLVYLGGNGVWDGLKVSDAGVGTGLQGDDELVASAHIGSGYVMNQNGRFQVPDTYITNAIGSYFAVIAFKDASGNEASGILPADVSIYGLATTGTVIGATTTDGAYITTAGDTATQHDKFYVTITMVPEPASMALGLLGLGILVARRIRK